MIDCVVAARSFVDVGILLLEGDLRPADNLVLLIPLRSDSEADHGAAWVAVRAGGLAHAAAVAHDGAEALALRDVAVVPASRHEYPYRCLKTCKSQSFQSSDHDKYDAEMVTCGKARRWCHWKVLGRWGCRR
jgi:hypothetical protein